MLGNISGKTGYAPMQPNQMQLGFQNDPVRTIQPINAHPGVIANPVAPPMQTTQPFTGWNGGHIAPETPVNWNFNPAPVGMGGIGNALMNLNSYGSSPAAGLSNQMQTTQPFNGWRGPQMMQPQQQPMAYRPQSLLGHQMVK